MIQKIPEGKIELCVQFVSYVKQCVSVIIEEERTSQILIQLTPKTMQLGEATISGTRRLWETTNTVAMHKLTPATINKIPSLTGIPDLGDYLQVLPGIIFTGDQGGQFYVRGGAPVHNLVKLDGMTVIKPFHSIGFVSVFDTETIASADVYTAGLGAEYGGRLSSVIDIRTRPGNRRQFKGTVNMTNFGYGLTLDVPIIKIGLGVGVRFSFHHHTAGESEHGVGQFQHFTNSVNQVVAPIVFFKKIKDRSETHVASSRKI